MSVKGVKEQVIEGKTPEITIDHARTLQASVDTGHVVGLRDRGPHLAGLVPSLVMGHNVYCERASCN